MIKTHPSITFYTRDARERAQKKRAAAEKRKVEPEKDQSGEHEEENSLYGSYQMLRRKDTAGSTEQSSKTHSRVFLLKLFKKCSHNTFFFNQLFLF
jgi:hypothetical protein